MPPTRLVLLLNVALTACPGEKDTGSCDPEGARLRTATLVFDAGVVAVNGSEDVLIYLAKYGSEPVTVTGVSIDDASGGWSVVEGWATTTITDSTGAEVPALVLEGDCADLPTYAVVHARFSPTEAGLFRATLSITSDAPGGSPWSVTLRGQAASPCGRFTPLCMDMGDATDGASTYALFTVWACGQVPWTISSFAASGGFEWLSPSPLTILPGSDESLYVQWTSTGDSHQQAELSFVTDDPTLEDVLQLHGNADEGVCGDDADGDGLSEMQGDCDDGEPRTYPHAHEDYDTVDNDCDGVVDEGTYSNDDDGDGFAEVSAEAGGDCDDGDPWTWPGAIEDCDGADNDCDGVIDEGSAGDEGAACAPLTDGLPE